MKLNDIVANEKHGNGLLGLLIFLLVVGVTVGSVYLAKNSVDMAEGIKNYIGSFCTAVSENKNSFNGIFAIRFYCNGSDYCKERVYNRFYNRVIY